MLRIPGHVFMLEETVVDPSKQLLQLKSKNISLNQIMQMEEKCTYKPHNENLAW
jgi:hypothetical protein